MLGSALGFRTSTGSGGLGAFPKGVCYVYVEGYFTFLKAASGTEIKPACVVLHVNHHLR